MCTYSPQEKIIVEFIKWTHSKVYTPLILNTVLLLNDPQLCFFCSVIVVHESLVSLEQLNCLLFFRKILQVPQTLWFFSIFVDLNPFQQWLYDIYIFKKKNYSYRTVERWDDRQRTSRCESNLGRCEHSCPICWHPNYEAIGAGDCDFQIHFFTPKTTEGLVCDYYRRFKCPLMLQKEKPCIKTFYRFCTFDFNCI